MATPPKRGRGRPPLTEAEKKKREKRAQKAKEEAAAKREKEREKKKQQMLNKRKCRACGIGDAIDVVEDAPTALERTAEWIAQDEDKTMFMCSNCHARNNRDRYNYCPNCGSLMENRL